MSKAPHTIFLLRHGEVDGPGAIYGRTDVPLSDEGWAQLRRQSKRLPSLSKIVTSPLQRCNQFARELQAERGIPLQVVKDLQECDFGKWDGVPFDDIPKSAWAEMEAFWQSPDSCQFEGGEHLEAMHNRVAKAWDALNVEINANEQSQTVLVLAHGGVIRLILAYVLQLDWWNSAIFSQWQIDYASLTKLTLPRFEGAKANVNYVAMPHNNEA